MGRGDLSPRSRLLKHGPEALDDAELLAVAVRAGGAEGLAEARRLLSAAGGARQLLGAKRERLRSLGLPDRAMASLLAFRELTCRALRPEPYRPVLDRPAAVAEYLQARHLELDQEIMGAFFLDARQRLMDERVIFRGQLHRASVEPRPILRQAIELGAPFVLVWHSHPSGDPAPSAEDLEFTRRIAEAGELLGVALVDHLILGAHGAWVSLSRRGAF